MTEEAAKPAKPNLRLVPAVPPPLVAHMDEGGPSQGEMPFALVAGEPVTELPRDLYIPPYALEVFLEAFEGPLDLLLYLIRRQNLDILDIPIAEISRQYVQYIELMTEMQFELAGEYLVMAATLAEIKSRMLLPRSGRRGGRGRSARRARAPSPGVRAVQEGRRRHRRARAARARRAAGERRGRRAPGRDEAARHHAERAPDRLQGRARALERCSRTITCAASRCRCASACRTSC